MDGCCLRWSCHQAKGHLWRKPIPINKEQFSLRDQALQSRETYEHTGNEDYNKEGNDVFWKAEFMLREIFDIQEGDEASLKTILHYTFRDAIRKRQENYRYLLEHLPERSDIRPVFPYLSDDICPMFSLSLWKTGTLLSSIWQTGTFRLKYTGLYHLL